MSTSVGEQWRLLRDSFANYFSVYGGWRSLLSSAHLIIAAALTVFCGPLWVKPDWWNDVLAITPSILGFSLGGYAILLAFGSDDFRKLSAGELDGEASPWMELSAAFVHFIVVQLLGLGIALIAKGRPFSTLGIEFPGQVWVTTAMWGLGFLVFSYGLTLILASTFRILSVTRAFDTFVAKERSKHEVNEKK